MSTSWRDSEWFSQSLRDKADDPYGDHVIHFQPTPFGPVEGEVAFRMFTYDSATILSFEQVKEFAENLRTVITEHEKAQGEHK